MGYILPVTPYIYSNYQKRVTRKKQRYHHIGRKPPVSFREIIHEMESESVDNRFTLKNKRQQEKRKVVDARNLPQFQSKWVRKGKGQQVNIQI